MSQDLETTKATDDQLDQHMIRFREIICDARQSASLSYEDVAKKMCLSVHIIIAIENADFSALGAPVFIRGHLRSYEKLLGLPSSELVNLYTLIQPSDNAWKISASSYEKQTTIGLRQWKLIFVLILAIAAVVLFFFAEDGYIPAPAATIESEINNNVEELK